ncbi:uncharacterized protein V1518DRAFT_279298 [Limtongia smithiae]|uniref:uncharacterized protein n=1 Tax=Limtongia smithiae TaxID=1125753 RepID=UPI0034CD3A4B
MPPLLALLQQVLICACCANNPGSISAVLENHSDVAASDSHGMSVALMDIYPGVASSCDAKESDGPTISQLGSDTRKAGDATTELKSIPTFSTAPPLPPRPTSTEKHTPLAVLSTDASDNTKDNTAFECSTTAVAVASSIERPHSRLSVRVRARLRKAGKVAGCCVSSDDDAAVRGVEMTRDGESTTSEDAEFGVRKTKTFYDSDKSESVVNISPISEVGRLYADDYDDAKHVDDVNAFEEAKENEDQPTDVRIVDIYPELSLAIVDEYYARHGHYVPNVPQFEYIAEPPLNATTYPPHGSFAHEIRGWINNLPPYLATAITADLCDLWLFPNDHDFGPAAETHGCRACYDAREYVREVHEEFRIMLTHARVELLEGRPGRLSSHMMELIGNRARMSVHQWCLPVLLAEGQVDDENGDGEEEGESEEESEEE